MKLECCTTSCIYMALGAGRKHYLQVLVVMIVKHAMNLPPRSPKHDSSDSSKCNENKGTLTISQRL